MKVPGYFEKIRSDSERRWRQLDADSVLAAPWHQLFRQVQSPRHVVSELLQNADDTGAKKASVRIEDGFFMFEHDGGDFNEEQFTSLCRFGFSNKRNLHTIGFRGVGFKSTFSLGDKVEVLTPTLAVTFGKKRFTEPVWNDGIEKSRRTIIRVKIADRNRRSELERNFAEWAASPSALLFFNSIEELTIDGQTVRKKVLRDGPVLESWWIRLAGADHKEDLLLVRSKPEPFPDEAIEEIRAERSVEDLHLPPCQVEVVLGLDGSQRLFVVLPTGAEVPLPFSCNAPFIQDPARFAIKDPTTSPTNRWLLERAGRLAGETLRAWVGNKSLDIAERAEAYSLFPSVTDFKGNLGGACGEAISQALFEVLEGRPIALTTAGVLATPGNCVAVPEELHQVWSPPELIGLFGEDQAHLLAAEVAEAAQQVLVRREWISVVNGDDAVTRLEDDPSPLRPQTWEALQVLWDFVQDKVQRDWNHETRRSLKIVPVTGERNLHAAKDVIRLSSRRDAVSEADWNFITDHAHAVDSGWIEWLSTKAARRGGRADASQVDRAVTLLQVLALNEPSAVDRIVAKASERIFTGGSIPVANCIRIAQIMAALGAKVPQGFKYVTKDLHLRDVNAGIVADDTGEIEDIVPEAWAEQHILHPDYTAQFTSAKRDVWQAWVRSEASGLNVSPPVHASRNHLNSRSSVEKFVGDRGAQKPSAYHYQRSDFSVHDFGLDRDLMKHWREVAKSDAAIWATVLEMVLAGPPHGWKEKLAAEIRHNGNRFYKTLSCGFIPAEWIVHFRSIACLSDTQGTVSSPVELLLRTPDTEPLIGIEPFVLADLDTEQTKPLLKLLGVRDTPLGSDRILDRLRAHARMPEPLRFIAEITRLYQALDRVVNRCAPAHLKALTQTFADESLILTESLEWVTSGETSIFADEHSDSAMVHSSARRFALWPRLGVPERPAVEHTIEWLQSLESGSRIDGASAKRMRAVLQREPIRIWQACGHWLSLDSTWEPVGRFKYRLTMQGLMKWGELAPFIKKATANLQILTADTMLLPPFSELRDLNEVVELRITKSIKDSNRTAIVPDWLNELAVNLCRIKLTNDAETVRVRSVAQRLYRTTWQPVIKLEVTPYVDGTPSGEPFRPKAFWLENELSVSALSAARLHKELVDELSRPFAHPGIAVAISACVDRVPEFVREYLASEFQIDPNLPLPGLEDDTPVSAAPSTRAGSTSLGSKEGQGETDENDEPESEETEEAGELDDQDERPPEHKEDSTPEQPPATSRNASSADSTLISRYARTRGFHWNGDSKQYAHPDGRCVGKSASPFNWEERAADGDLINRLWVSDQKLANGVEIAADLWVLMKEAPSATIIVVLGSDHEPCILSGDEVLALQQTGQVKLYPSRYRLVQSD